MATMTYFLVQFDRSFGTFNLLFGSDKKMLRNMQLIKSLSDPKILNIIFYPTKSCV